MAAISVRLGCRNKTHRLRDLNLISHSSGDCKSKIEVPAGSVSGEDALCGLQTAASLLCAHTVESRERVLSGASSYRH